MKKQTFKLFTVLIAVALIAVMALTGCSNRGAPPNHTNSSPPEEIKATDIGEGATAFPFEVKDDKGVVQKYSVHTDEETVGAALLAVGLVEGETSAYGLYVKSVNGLRADYDADGAYWEFHVNGVMAAEGADSTDIEQGKTYAFIYTKA
ncbi:MAG: DUF4430 domain-containing protein [Oscillospiraceae bacterium]|nr:DUF4430 domain-containing protein [Oscillospiraceae bacterium]